MKMLKYAFVILLLAASLWSCENQEVTFDDFDYTTAYFPLQSPLRTLVLGDDRIDNSLDNELKFNIGVSVGGLYTNGQDWFIEVDYDNELAANLKTVAGDTIMVLPQSYIQGTTPGLPGEARVPSGEFNGLIEFQLTDNFLDDPLAWKGQYVIPLRIVNASTDSILLGSPAVIDPDKRIDADWEAGMEPKDYTLFGIKFVNPYHGSYLHKGKSVETNANGEVVNEIVYSENFLTQNGVWSLSTQGRNLVATNGVAQNLGADFGMLLNIEGGSVTVSSMDGATTEISGSGTFVEANDGGEEWGGSPHNTIYLNYSYQEGGNTFSVSDTLVLRDRNIVFEELDLQVVE